jgi:hypothetical protein
MLGVRSVRLRAVALEFLTVAGLLAPLAFCLASDVIHTSLWLDEVTYYYYENDMALRAAELGRPGRAFVPYLGVFFHCDVQRLLHAVVRPFGLTLARDPELYLRFSSVGWYLIALLAFYAYLRRRLPGRRLDAFLGAMAFGSMPLLLHYAFEARVYGMTTMLVLLLLIAIDWTAKKTSPARLAVVALLALVTAHSHLWTLPLFGALLVVVALQVRRTRKITAWGRSAAAAALPALALIGVETLYMKLTDPGAPLFPPFNRQPGLSTLYQLVLSNFAGVLQTQYVVLSSPSAGALAVTACFAILVLALLSVRDRHDAPDGSLESDWPVVAVLSFFFCWLLAVLHGYFIFARYHLPLLGAMLFAIARTSSNLKRLILGLLITCNIGLLAPTIDAIRLKGSMKQVADMILEKGGRDVSLVCQHVVSGLFALPAEATVLDFYLNVLHPHEPPIPIYEQPDLSLMNGRRGVYDLFAGGAPVFKHYLASKPDLWRRKLDEMRPHLFVLQQVWNIEEGNRQNQEFARVVLERGDREVVGKYFIPGFPRPLLIELRRTTGR